MTPRRLFVVLFETDIPNANALHFEVNSLKFVTAREHLRDFRDAFLANSVLWLENAVSCGVY